MKQSISSQQQWQNKQRKRGLCIKCGKPGAPKGDSGVSQYCLAHLVTQREKARAALGSKRRNDSLSYQLEAQSTRPRKNGGKK